MELLREYVQVNGINLSDATEKLTVVNFIRDNSSDPTAPTYWVTALEAWYQNRNVTDAGAAAGGTTQDESTASSELNAGVQGGLDRAATTESNGSAGTAGTARVFGASTQSTIAK